MRYTRREVFRLSNKVVDNQVVTECYIQSRRANQDTKQSFGDNDSLDDLGSSISISLLRVKSLDYSYWWLKLKRNYSAYAFMNKDQHVQAKPTLKFDTDVHDPARDYKDSLS